MKIYLVGGAVRDNLLGLTVKDQDWVVVGASQAQMKELGYQAVGRDFPVFLHPQTHEEYALARTERKSGHGYTGFVFHAAPDVTLEEDLARRDLTINAMARDSEGNLTDPFGGLQDLQDKQLRHVSPAFCEDPLRVLRVARFAARYHKAGFRIAEPTFKLMQTMSASGELQHLVAERVWQETVNALAEPSADIYFSTLQDCGALAIVLPEIADSLQNLQQFPLNTLRQAQQQQLGPLERFACISLQTLNAHPQGCQAITALSQRLRLPHEYRDLALMLNNQLPEYQQRPMDAAQLWQLIENLDGLRRPDRLNVFLRSAALISTALHQPTLNPDVIMQLLSEVRMIDSAQLIAQGFRGKALGAELRAQRINMTAMRLPQIAAPQKGPSQ